MNDTAVSRPQVDTYAQIRVREPAGERDFGARLTLGGEGADVVVPGVSGVAVGIERRRGEWFVSSQQEGKSRYDGRLLGAARELHRNDVVTVGDAHVTVSEVTRTLLTLEVHHLVSNTTIAPVTEVALFESEAGDEDLEIRASVPLAAAAPGERLAAGAPPAVTPKEIATGVTGRGRGYWAAAVAAAIVAVLAVAVGLFLSRRGTPVTGGIDQPSIVSVDTQGIAATVSMDGAEAGRAPGDISVPAGRRTLTVHAPRYLDAVTTLLIDGSGARRQLRVALRPSFGKLRVSSSAQAARITVDDGTAVTGEDARIAGQPLPATLEVSSGVHRIEISGPGFKPWQTSVVVKAGETLALGPIALGQPDAKLVLSSTPAHAEVAVGGVLRGRTPLTLDLPAGMSHEVVVSLPGYTSFRQSVAAEPGKTLELIARLSGEDARVTIRGEPQGAQIKVDGADRGAAPRTLTLSAMEHRIEVSREGFQPFSTSVTAQKGLDRTLEYRLLPADHVAALAVTAQTVKTQAGYVLKLIPLGKFLMGSERREQGRRPNEGLREVTFKRPFYVGVTEVTNGEFRKFRPEHVSGYLDRKSLDLDQQPVVLVSWDDAVAYCNWLSEREGLAPAYEKRDGKYLLKQPATAGYRLPTEAEWEYAARWAGPEKSWRFIWGDTLPVGESSGNLAGAEAKDGLPAVLDGYRDDYPVVAPVGKFHPNALGLHDLGGNVTEWVNDFYQSFFDSTPSTDPLGPAQSSSHVVRGPNWKTAAVSELRLAWRDTADGSSQIIGFRIARYAE